MAVFLSGFVAVGSVPWTAYAAPPKPPAPAAKKPPAKPAGKPDDDPKRAEARKKYAETSLALLDFYDARDRAGIVRYQEEIDRINALIEERKRTRAELEKLLAP